MSVISIIFKRIQGKIETGEDPGERKDIIKQIIKAHNLEDYVELPMYDFT